MSKKKSTRNSVILILLAGVLYWGFHIFQNGTEGILPESDTVSASTPDAGSESGLKAGADNTSVSEVAAAGNAPQGLEIPKDMKKRAGQLLRHTGYTVSYSAAWGEPYWSAWVLTAGRTQGTTKRDNYGFAPDPLLPESEAVVTQDYSGSGYDRGHMCPAGDNKWNARAMEECFYLTNICPQVPNLNRGDWKELEDACRDWARAGYTLYIACGPLFTSASPKRIGKQHKIAVPDGFFKVILRRKGNRQQALGFLYKNGKQNMPMSAHATSVDEVESLTGFDFFSLLPDAEEKKLEASRSTSGWGF